MLEEVGGISDFDEFRGGWGECGDECGVLEYCYCAVGEFGRGGESIGMGDWIGVAVGVALRVGGGVSLIMG